MAEIRAALKLLPGHAARGDLPGLAAAARELLPALRELQAADAAEATLRLERVAEEGGEVAGAIVAWQRATASLELDLTHGSAAPPEGMHVRGLA
jgi:hypothetical protein